MKKFTILISLVVILVCTTCVWAVGAEMVFIPGGEFEMGRYVGSGDADELPIHDVYVDSFYMGKYEITNQQYCDYLNAAYPAQVKVVGGIVYAADDGDNSDPYCNTHSYDVESQIEFSDPNFSVNIKDGTIDMSNHPMLKVSWYGCVAYCNYYGYRLPTEAEWEYAARGGEYSPYYRYPWGNSIDPNQANYLNSGDPYETGADPETTPVGYYDGNQIPAGTDMANGYGLYDMSGNVWEWCNDRYDSTYYNVSPYDNPEGPASGTYRVHRGGSWYYVASNCRAADRDYDNPNDCYSSGGFRIVQDSITLLNPNGGEELIAGSTHTIEWNNVIVIDNVSLEYSDANGIDGSWELVHPEPNTPNDGEYEWTVPQVTSNQCLVKVSDATDSNIYDTSDDVFTIYVCQGPVLGDVNNDCYFNLIDFALLAANWLGCGNPFDPACTIDNGLVSYWKFDEDNGTTAYDSAGNNDGTLVGDPNWVDGISGTALDFDGIDDHVQIPDSPSLRFGDDYSLAFWTKTPFNQVYQQGGWLYESPTIFDKDVGGWGKPDWSVKLRDGRLLFMTCESNDGILWSSTIANDEWHYIVLTREMSSGQKKIYVDGDLDATSQATCSISNTEDLYIGSFRGDGATWKGSIDEVRIYNRALTPDEIEYLYQNP